MYYPVIIEKDGDSYMARFPDIPEALTCGDTREEALTEAAGALLTAFEFYFEDNRAVPMPSAGEGLDRVAVPAGVWVKVLLLNEMVRQSVPQAELARRIGKKKQELQRIIDLRHNTKIDTLDLAMGAMGKHLTIEAQ